MTDIFNCLCSGQDLMPNYAFSAGNELLRISLDYG